MRADALKTYDQMVQAARSGRQNIAEGSQALVGVARASLEELLIDYEDYLRQHKLELWGKESDQARAIRGLAYKSDRTDKTYFDLVNTSCNEGVILLL